MLSSDMDPRVDAVLEFWFGPEGAGVEPYAERWWRKDPAFDAEIRARFGALFEAAAAGDLTAWSQAAEPRPLLALIVLLDQFSRNIARGTPQAFAQDAAALAVSLAGQARALDRRLSYYERYMFYMPLMHAEDKAIQERSVQAFAALASEAEHSGAPESVVKALRSAHDFALRHAEIVQRFGRFPHRNAILNRVSTPAEQTFLLEPNSGF